MSGNEMLLKIKRCCSTFTSTYIHFYKNSCRPISF